MQEPVQILPRIVEARLYRTNTCAHCCGNLFVGEVFLGIEDHSLALQLRQFLEGVLHLLKEQQRLHCLIRRCPGVLYTKMRRLLLGSSRDHWDERGAKPTLAPQFVVAEIAHNAKEEWAQILDRINPLQIHIERQKRILNYIVLRITLADEPPHEATHRWLKAFLQRRKGSTVACARFQEKTLLTTLRHPYLLSYMYTENGAQLFI